MPDGTTRRHYTRRIVASELRMPRKVGTTETDARGRAIAGAPRMAPDTFKPSLAPRVIRLADVEIRAALRGGKCELRRPLRIVGDLGQIKTLDDVDGNGEQWRLTRNYSTDRATYHLTREQLCKRCPYGIPGVELHVSEWWTCDPSTGEIVYRADAVTTSDRERIYLSGASWKITPPPGEMPPRLRWRIVDLWIDRLQPMGALQLRNEGWLDARIPKPTEADARRSREAFASNWNRSTSDADYVWSKNPWVWVMSLARVETQHG